MRRTVVAPGRMVGSPIRRKIDSSLVPSIMAASNISSGTWFQYTTMR